MNKCELAEEYKHYFGDLAGPIIVQFKEVLTSQAFNENINAPFTMKVVKVLLDKTHGVILSCNSLNSAYIWTFTNELMSKIYIGLFKLYKQQKIVQKILSIWGLNFADTPGSCGS